jgi:hypothetical protein
MNKVIKYLKDNKILIAVIILLLTAGIYIGMLSMEKQAKDNESNATLVPGQQVLITDSNGFSVNGDVIVEQGGSTVVNGPGKTTTVTEKAAAAEEVYVPTSERASEAPPADLHK